MRTITLGIRTKKVRMTLWEGTAEEEKFEVRGINGDAPYVRAYGTKYFLTSNEARVARELARLAGGRK